MPPTNPRLSSVLPPLIFGTATFNYQYTPDPFKLPTTALVHKALAIGVRAFDTSPYYGPAEEILGKALITPYESTNAPFHRSSYFLLTKVGRISGSTFNYSAPWVYESIQRSLTRLHTKYLDVAYCHDVEFVTPAEVLIAVTELRRIRDEEGTIKYIGISGYPVSVLADLAELILTKTGEPLDCVMSYGNFTLQNRRLKTDGLKRLKGLGVDVVPNASILGMGLLRKGGVPLGGMGDWHPAPEGLRKACWEASEYCDSKGERLEAVAIRWALETWLVEGESVGSSGDDPASDMERGQETIGEVAGRRLGVSVMGVSNMKELDETMKVWRSILDRVQASRGGTASEISLEGDHEFSLKKQADISAMADVIWEKFGEWQDYAWASPGKDFLRGAST